jgi:signal peptidase II
MTTGDSMGAPEDAHDVSPGGVAGRWRFEALLAVLIIAADQAAKAMVRASIPLHESVTVIPGMFYLTHVRNTGAAFGFLNAVEFPYKSSVVALIATSALVAIAAFASHVAPKDRWSRVSFSLILGGAVGNLIDRLALGSVVDYADVVFGTWHFWAFNVADAAITIGVTMLILDMIGLGRHVSTTS